MKRLLLISALLIFVLAGCRNETQNRLRRSIQDFTNTRMYITLYSHDGVALFTGTVDGKVTRSNARGGAANETVSGAYIFWYDDRGRYHQSDLPYLVTTYDRSESLEGSSQ
ncbi:MAG: hypothetical protein JSV66_11620 [Trueperaceae bacterium]|nr:MAG: hypothetical protein JSV66_11620 [Trueperaceae bacterium]